MDPKSALELIDEVCGEIDQRRARSGRSTLMQRARPIGLGLLLGLGTLGAAACGGDDRDKPRTDGGYDLISPGDATYGVPWDSYHRDLKPLSDVGRDLISPGDATYGVPDAS